MVRRHPVWLPEDAHQALLPSISGNELNGVGDAEIRQPRQIFWLKKTAGHPFGPLQDVYAKADRGIAPRSEPAPVTQSKEPAEWTALVKTFALEHEADQVGIATADPAWFFEGYTADLPFIVLFALAMDHGSLSQQPSTVANPTAQVEVAIQYNRGARVASRTAGWFSPSWVGDRDAVRWGESDVWKGIAARNLLELVVSQFAGRFLGDGLQIVDREYPPGGSAQRYDLGLARAAHFVAQRRVRAGCFEELQRTGDRAEFLGGEIETGLGPFLDLDLSVRHRIKATA
jgi:hypothetical protein